MKEAKQERSRKEDGFSNPPQRPRTIFFPIFHFLNLLRICLLGYWISAKRLLMSAGGMVFLFVSLSASLPLHSAESDTPAVVVVVGAAGEEHYGEVFRENAKRWREACERGAADFTLIGEGAGDEDPNDRNRLRDLLSAADERELWLVLIGHGSYDGRTAKFNLRGPDFSDADLAEWTRDFSGELVVVNTSAASGSFLPALSGPDRVVITATKSASELDYARFGTWFAEAVGGLPEADLDNDDQVSLLECFLHAAGKVRTFYEEEGRIATEHPLLDDNGDGLGTRPEWFEGATVVKTPADGAEPDGDRARQKVLVRNESERNLTGAQRQRRDELEREVRALRRKKGELDEEEYYRELEKCLLEIARIYRAAESS